MAGRDDTQAAYFSLLRAREELDALRRYDEFLRDEQRRLRRFTREGEALAEPISRRVRRPLGPSDTLLADALEQREAIIADELEHLPERIAAAEAYVAECEQEHDVLRRRSA